MGFNVWVNYRISMNTHQLLHKFSRVKVGVFVHCQSETKTIGQMFIVLLYTLLVCLPDDIAVLIFVLSVSVLCNYKNVIMILFH